LKDCAVEVVVVVLLGWGGLLEGSEGEALKIS
jgi:hypothetical protein